MFFLRVIDLNQDLEYWNFNFKDFLHHHRQILRNKNCCFIDKEQNFKYYFRVNLNLVETHFHLSHIPRNLCVL
jgi:hypothetical protein